MNIWYSFLWWWRGSPPVPVAKPTPVEPERLIYVVAAGPCEIRYNKEEAEALCKEFRARHSNTRIIESNGQVDHTLVDPNFDSKRQSEFFDLMRNHQVYVGKSQVDLLKEIAEAKPKKYTDSSCTVCSHDQSAKINTACNKFL